MKKRLNKQQKRSISNVRNIIHILERFEERQDISFGALEKEDIFNQIKNGTAEFLRYKKSGQIYKVILRGKEIAVVMSRALDKILTTYDYREDLKWKEAI